MEAGAGGEKCELAWFRKAAAKAFTDEARKSLEAAFKAELDSGPLRG